VTAASFSHSLRHLADFAEIRGNSLEATDWRRLADDLDRAGDDELAGLADLARQNLLSQLNAVHHSLHSKLRDLLVEGPELAIAAAETGLPWLLRRLLELSVIDSAGAAALSRAGLITVSDLRTAFEDGRLTPQLYGYEEALRDAWDALEPGRLRVTLGRAVELIETLIALVKAAHPEVQNLTPAGDLRRCEPIVSMLSLVGVSADPVAALDALERIPALRILHRTTRRAVVAYQQAEIDIRMVAADEFGTVLHTTTGSREHLRAMRVRQPMVRLCAREADVYAHAGLPWIAPELRRDGGEIEAAADGRLPDLITRKQIRGDLHMHTTYSDGRDSLSVMVAMCATLGYEYIAITDHSERAGASRTVTRHTLAAQRDEIERLRERHPGLTILHGIEVDIMPDGRLDFPDDVLERLDLVLASLHDSAGHDGARLTRRCLAAIEHPLVNVITHPSNQLVGRMSGYDLDFPAIYAAAATSGTALEVDGAPSHLDLDGDRAREAIAVGVTLVVDSDCHKARLLDRQMRLGVGTARRGWVEARHVLNSRPIAEVRAFIEAKRRYRA
jgi:DNA polymerase (family 10)